MEGRRIWRARWESELELTGTEMSGLEKGVRWDLDKERTGSVV